MIEETPREEAPRRGRRKKRIEPDSVPGYHDYRREMPRSPKNPEKPLKVEVVDDDPDICKVLRIFFWTRGLEVVEAPNGTEGVAAAKKEQPDVVLLDIMMPDIDGFEVYHRLKLDPETQDIPVIFVSAKADARHIQEGLSLGAEGYVTKPFDPADLLDRIIEVARASAGAGPGGPRA